MPPPRITFSFRRGEDIQIDWTEHLNSSPTSAIEDITGWTFDFKVKQRASDIGASLIVSTTTVVLAASGTFKTVIAAAQSALLQGDYQHALWRTNAGAEACLAEGIFSITDTVRD